MTCSINGYPEAIPRGHSCLGAITTTTVRFVGLAVHKKGEMYREPQRRRCTMVDNSQEYRCKYWATRSSVRSFARTAHSFTCSGMLTLYAPSAALTHSLTRSLRSLPRLWKSEFFMSQNDLVLSNSAKGRVSQGMAAGDTTSL